MATIANNLQLVRNRISQACLKVHRPESSVTLLAVSKTFPAENVREAFNAGQKLFGENYVQEALEKIAALSDIRDRIEWHLIGPLQSNKTRPVAEAFDWVHTVDRLKVAERLSEQRPPHLPPLQVCVQVNTSGEDSKSGCDPDASLALAQAVAQLPRLTLRGIMALPAPSPDPAVQHAALQQVRRLFEQWQAAGLDVDTVSMGMSNDLEAAVEEGATLVRIGTAIFGQR
ncbi:MAG: YggS family pyridoxal phosphate-dependent enzyme [Burkholderiales bacterium]|nr:YggS family pyridoxal phosphate-dependent enzyme [Burkholderiales bacterium]